MDTGKTDVLKIMRIVEGSGKCIILYDNKSISVQKTQLNHRNKRGLTLSQKYLKPTGREMTGPTGRAVRYFQNTNSGRTTQK